MLILEIFLKSLLALRKVLLSIIKISTILKSKNKIQIGF